MNLAAMPLEASREEGAEWARMAPDPRRCALPGSELPVALVRLRSPEGHRGRAAARLRLREATRSAHRFALQRSTGRPDLRQGPTGRPQEGGRAETGASSAVPSCHGGDEREKPLRRDS